MYGNDRCFRVTRSCSHRKQGTFGNLARSKGGGVLLGDDESPLPNMFGTMMKYWAGSRAMPGPMSQSLSQCQPAAGLLVTSSLLSLSLQSHRKVFPADDRCLDCKMNCFIRIQQAYGCRSRRADVACSSRRVLFEWQKIVVQCGCKDTCMSSAYGLHALSAIDT